MQGRGTLLAIAGIVMLAIAGCAAAPSFRVERVRATQETDEGVVLEFTILGENRREIPLPLREVRYQLALDGQVVFKGSRSPEATLGRYGTQAFRVPVAIDRSQWTGDLDGQTPYRFNATVFYQKPGSLAELLFETEIRRPHVSFVEQGQLDFDPDDGEEGEAGP